MEDEKPITQEVTPTGNEAPVEETKPPTPVVEETPAPTPQPEPQPQPNLEDLIKKAVAEAVSLAVGEVTKQFTTKMQEQETAHQTVVNTLKVENQELKRTAPTGVPNPPPFVDDEQTKRIKQTADVAESYRKGYRA